MRVADFVAATLAEHGIRHVFLVTGGGAMHLNDAIGRCPELEYVCCHHEQACAMAAEAYARLTNRIAAVNVTTGPGGINALNGVFGAFTDSIPMLVVSGQVKRETCLYKHGLIGKLRQLGDQEADIVGMVKGITKYAVTIDDPKSIRYHLERALYLAKAGRPGPCWIDIPIDVQGSQIEPGELESFVPPSEDSPLQGDALRAQCASIRNMCCSAARPALLVGAGIRLGGARDLLLSVLEHWKIPITTGWNAHDTIWNDHPMYTGRPGSIGDRSGNFTVQNSDFLLVLGSRLNVRQVSYNWKSFARAAFKVIVDIDPAELDKPTVKADLPVCADVRLVLEELLALPPLPASETRAKWLAWCVERKEKYPVVLPEYRQRDSAVNPYCFVESLFERLKSDDVVVCGDGTACVTSFQAAHLQRDQRLFTNSGSASMGYDLPGAIGACFANDRKRVICLAGDGSIQMNLQELQTIRTHHLPIKIFVLNNRGYHSIRQTQQNFFPDNVVGCGEESGLGFPSFEKLAAVYDLPYTACRDHVGLAAAIAATLDSDSAALCEVFLDLNQQFAPKLASQRRPDGVIVSPSLEDMAPFLDRDELRANLLIPEATP